MSDADDNSEGPSPEPELASPAVLGDLHASGTSDISLTLSTPAVLELDAGSRRAGGLRPLQARLVGEVTPPPQRTAAPMFGVNVVDPTFMAEAANVEAESASSLFGESATVVDGAPPPSVNPPAEFRDANIEGATAAATAEGLPGSVTTEMRPFVIGDSGEPDWWAELPPGIPNVVRTAAVRGRAIDELRRIEDVLREALPGMSGLESSFVQEAIRGPIIEAIELLSFSNIDGTWGADQTSAPKFDHIVFLLKLAVKIASGLDDWKDAADLVCKALAIFGVDCANG